MAAHPRRRILLVFVICAVVLGLILFFAGLRAVQWCDDGPEGGECHTSWTWDLW